MVRALPAFVRRLAGVAKALPRLAELGFDVVYLPPIHPIGADEPKGREQRAHAGPGDPGTPWAIGSDGGRPRRDRIPRSGRGPTSTRGRRRAAAGLEIALDFAIQCSPDHPWLTEHPSGSTVAPTARSSTPRTRRRSTRTSTTSTSSPGTGAGLWQALRDVVLFWVERGVTVFRVDNPHTKPLAFWEWLIAEVRARTPR